MTPEHILIVSENYTMGGLETNIAGQIRVLASEGVRFTIATGRNAARSALPSEIDNAYLDLPLAIRDAELEREAADRIARIIEEDGVDLVHAHPFASIIPSFLAAEETGVPLVCTLHGPDSVSGVFGREYERRMHAALRGSSCVLAVSPEVRDLAAEFDIASELVPNSVRTTNALPGTLPQSPTRWLVASRLDAAKTTGIRRFLAALREFNDSPVHIAGDGTEAEALRAEIDSGVFGAVLLLGRRDDLPELMSSYDIVGGMGRVALEALGAGRPALLIGYDGPVGLLLHEEDVSRAAETNFSGRGQSPLSGPEFASVMQQAAGCSVADAVHWVRQHCDEDLNWSRVLDRNFTGLSTVTPTSQLHATTTVVPDEKAPRLILRIAKRIRRLSVRMWNRLIRRRLHHTHR